MERWTAYTAAYDVHYHCFWASEKPAIYTTITVLGMAQPTTKSSSKQWVSNLTTICQLLLLSNQAETQQSVEMQLSW